MDVSVKVASNTEFDLDYLNAGEGVRFFSIECRFEFWEKMLSWPTFIVHVTLLKHK